MSERQWRPVVGSPGYEVSDDGSVRSPRGRVLRASPNSKGYWKVCLTRKRQEYVHRLVAIAFLGPPPSAHSDVDHIDFDKSNNAAANLRWLASTLNARRQRWLWTARTDSGRNVWTDMHHVPPPEDYVPMGEEELDDWASTLSAQGW